MWSMSWVRRVLTDTEDDGRFRSALGLVLGACLASLPLLFGALNAETSVLAALIGAVVAAPFWRFVGETIDGPVAIVAFVVFLAASLVVLRQLPSLAFPVFLGGYGFTLSALRFIAGWQHPVPQDWPADVERGPVRPFLVLALILPLALLVSAIVLVVWTVVEGRL